MITKENVLAAQDSWGSAIVEIGSHKGKETLTDVTSNIIDRLYAYELGTVLFKPTKAAEIQFRPTKESALSYFIGGNSNFPEDGGFAIQPWTAVRFENSDIILEENRAIAMGNYFFTDLDGGVTKVEYTFGYKKDGNGNLKIDLHHSSLPYNPA
ncbi:phosphoribosyl-AMP cyclohydrolase [Aureibacter tunicatorum]|uniref:Phosphoribosyl-AMP cyclohydrolase n=1 Tax=Aureibacter tunicatorum TaxID=866807 RepID=A0AAE3XHR0_9BACT|nr:phosphoribosyl-AMP cyclohydrolase [Aureibacter tunicatorum]MDR6237921.1 hypothetical protein [Aureibacter tunicatorum]BDD02954.1 phosphoribosyl-AMP cyclohydrolase [Aureibacter tunicatorum]